MIRLQDYLTEELEQHAKKALSDNAHERTMSYAFLVGMRQGAYHATGLQSDLYKKIESVLDEVTRKRQVELEKRLGSNGLKAINA